jgi:hypothetical protein
MRWGLTRVEEEGAVEAEEVDGSRGGGDPAGADEVVARCEQRIAAAAACEAEVRRFLRNGLGEKIRHLVPHA